MCRTHHDRNECRAGELFPSLKASHICYSTLSCQGLYPNYFFNLAGGGTETFRAILKQLFFVTTYWSSSLAFDKAHVICIGGLLPGGEGAEIRVLAGTGKASQSLEKNQQALPARKAAESCL